MSILSNVRGWIGQMIFLPIKSLNLFMLFKVTSNLNLLFTVSWRCKLNKVNLFFFRFNLSKIVEFNHPIMLQNLFHRTPNTNYIIYMLTLIK